MKKLIGGLIVGLIVIAAIVFGVSNWNRDPPNGAAPTGEKTPSNEPGVFDNLTATSGIEFTYRNGEEAGHATIFESLGGGVALLDYDGDGRLDIFLVGGGSFGGASKKEILGLPCKLFRNLGQNRFRDVSTEAGLSLAAWFYSHGCAVADYDNDGWPDLLITGWGRVALFHNEPNDAKDASKGRRFVDVTSAVGLDRGVTWGTSAGFGDLDGDGFPELYVCQYVNWSWANHPTCKDLRDGSRVDVCPPEKFASLPDLLFRNNGGKAFTLMSNVAGLRMPRNDADYANLKHLSPKAIERLRFIDERKNYGKGLGVLMADLNDDGRLDVCVANDTSGNFLYLNRGAGKLEDVGTESGIEYDLNGNAQGSMGIDAADYNGSGQLSVLVSNYQFQLHGLYRNRGKGQFAYASMAAGFSVLSRNLVGFGTGFLDFDLDGNEDLYLSNGHVVHYPPPPAEVKQRPVLMRNNRKSSDKPHEVAFEDVSDRAGPYFQTAHLGRGGAIGDLDNDGRPDLVLCPTNEPAVVLRNRHETGNHWLGIELIGRRYRDAVGAKLQLEVGDRTLTRAIKGGGSYLSANDRRVVFGLGTHAKVGKLTVRWPDGQSQVWSNLMVDRYWVLREGVENAIEREKNR